MSIPSDVHTQPLVLVADDDEFMIELLSTSLEGAGFEVDTVSDGGKPLRDF